MEKVGQTWEASGPAKEPDMDPFGEYVYDPKQEKEDQSTYEFEEADGQKHFIRRKRHRRPSQLDSQRRKIRVLENVEDALAGAETVARLFNDITKRIERIKGK